MSGRQPLFKRQTFATFAIDPSGRGGGGGGFDRVSWALLGVTVVDPLRERCARSYRWFAHWRAPNSSYLLGSGFSTPFD